MPAKDARCSSIPFIKHNNNVRAKDNEAKKLNLSKDSSSYGELRKTNSKYPPQIKNPTNNCTGECCSITDNAPTIIIL